MPPEPRSCCFCKCAHVLTFLSPTPCLLPASHSSSLLLLLSLLSCSSSFSPSLSLPHAWPGGSALMHHGTFCSSKSQCDSALCSDRTTTSLSIAAHRRCAAAEPVQGEDGSCERGSAGSGEEKELDTQISDQTTGR